MTLPKTKLPFAALLASCIVILGAPNASKAQEKLRITIPVPAFSYYSIYAARDLGYFRKKVSIWRSSSPRATGRTSTL